MVEFYGSAGRAGYRVHFLKSELHSKQRNARDVALIEVKVLSRA